VFVSADTFLQGRRHHTGAFFFQGAVSNNFVNAGTVTLNTTPPSPEPASVTGGVSI